MRFLHPARSKWISLLAAPLALELAAQPSAPEATLDAATLEERGATIGRIDIRIDNVFDTTDPAEDKRLYRWANRVHVKTRPRVVDSILLFEEDEPLQARLLEESARLLRERGFVSDAEIAADSYDPTTNTAGIDVWLRDSWSLEPDIKLSRKGGETEYGLGITDENLFGLGKRLTVAYESDIDRDRRLFAYSDANLRGSRTRLSVDAADASDGHEFEISAGRPFFALDTRWSLEGVALDVERVDSIYDLGEVIDEFRHDTRFVSIQGGRSPGLVDGMARRWLVGATLAEDLFQPRAIGPAPLLLPEDRKLVYPWVGMHWVGDDFREVSELNDMGRTEDVALGLDLFMSVGFARENFGSDRDATLFNFVARRGWEPGGPGRLFLLESSASGRNEKAGNTNVVVSLSGQYYRRNFGDQLFSASLHAVLADSLDADRQVLLGGDSGLRGYPIRYQSGERSAILTLEQRFFTDWYPFRLIRVGYAFFLDVARVWGADPRDTPNLDTLYDLGIGLRLSSPRSSSRSVVHVDLAFPVNAPADVDSLQISVEKRASF